MQTDYNCITVKMKLIPYNIVSLITHAGASRLCVAIVWFHIYVIISTYLLVRIEIFHIYILLLTVKDGRIIYSYLLALGWNLITQTDETDFLRLCFSGAHNHIEDRKYEYVQFYGLRRILCG
jgi:hypothetical protein